MPHLEQPANKQAVEHAPGPELRFSAFDALPHAALLLDGGGKIVFANSAWHAGVEAGLLSGKVGEEFAKVLTPGPDAVEQLTAKNVHGAVRLVMQAGKNAAAAHYRRAIGGKAIWFHVAVKRRTDDDGALLLFEDRTEIREHYTDAVEANRVMRDVLDHLPRRAFWKGIDGVIQGGNRSFFSEFGSESLIGRPIDDIPWPEALAEFFHETESHVVQMGEHRQEIVKFDGASGNGVRWFEATHAPLMRGDNVVIGTIGSFHDVTTEYSLREAVRASEERLRLTLEAAEFGTFDYDLATGRTVATDRCRQMLFYAPGEIADGVHAWTALTHPEDQAEAAWRVAAHINGDAENYTIEKRMLAKDRSWRWIRESGRIVERDPDGTPRRLVGICADITAEKTAGDRIRRIAHRLHLATQAAQSGIWEHDFATGKITWDERVYGIYGRSQHLFDTSDWMSCIHPGDIENVRAKGEAFFRGEGNFDAMYRVFKGDGTVAYVHSLGVIERSPKDEPLRAIGTIRDVTEAERSAEAVKLAKLQLETFVEHAPAAVAMFDKDLRCIVHSRRWLQDATRDATIGDDAATAYNAKWDGIVERCCAGETLKGVEEEYVRPDGSRAWMNWEALPWSDHRGEAGGAIIASEDVTKDIESRRQLEIANKRLGDFVATATDWLWESDAAGRVTTISQRFFDRTGYAKEEIIGVPLSAMKLSERHQPSESEGYRHLQERTDFRDLFYQFPLKSTPGALFYVRASGKAQYDELGAFTGYLGTASDVTEVVHQANAARQAQKLQAVGTLAAGVAHEFNNILAIIRGHADLAKRALQRGEAAGEDIDLVIGAAARGSTLTKGLLTFGHKNETDKITTFDLGGLVAEQRLFLRPLTGPQFEIVVEKSHTPALMRARRDGVAQALMNLVVNARDASPTGGKITLSVNAVEAADVVSRFAASPVEGRFVSVSVVDRGVGMDEAVMMRIFEPFFTTKDVGKGTGLGLQFVYQLIADSNGYLNVTSRPGKGTTFTLYFPESDAAAEETSVRAQAAANRYDGRTALVVDDEPSLVKIFSGILREMGFTLLSSTDPETALELVDSHVGTLDLILSDVLMPKMQGPKFVELATALQPDAAVLFVTGQTQRGAQDSAVLPAGANILRKPFTHDELAAAVSAAIKTAELRLSA